MPPSGPSPKALLDALLAPVENSLGGSVVRVYDLLLESDLGIVAETILHRTSRHRLPGSSMDDIRSVASHPMALAQCEKFFVAPKFKRVPAEEPPQRSRRHLLAVTNTPRALPAAARQRITGA